MIWFIWGLIVLLYFRTYKYCQMIDDPICRSACYWYYPTRAIIHPKGFYNKKRSWEYTFTNIIVHIAVCGALWAIWGWGPALLYAVMPTNVSGVAWATGNYYMTTVLFVLVAYYFQTTFVWGIVPAMVFYFTALHSTVSAIPYLFFMMAVHWYPLALLNIIPLIFFLTSKRFQFAIHARIEGHAKVGVVAGKFHWRNIFIMTKVVAYYTVLNFWPSRLGFFHEFGKPEIAVEKFARANSSFWLSGGFLLLFFIWGWGVNPIAVMGWFMFMGIHSQYVLLGQLVAERYMFIANVFFCVLVAQFLMPYPILFTILATLWLYRTHIYIPAWKHNVNLFSYSISAFPYTPENYGNIASYNLEQGEYRRSIQPLLLQIKYGTGDKLGLWINLASCYGKSGMPKQALHCTQEALKICRQPERTKSLKEQIYMLESKIQKAGRLQEKMNELLERKIEYEY